MPARYKDAPAAGKTVTKGVGSPVITGSGKRVQKGGTEQKGTQSGDPAAPSFVKLNNARPVPKNV